VSFEPAPPASRSIISSAARAREAPDAVARRADLKTDRSRRHEGHRRRINKCILPGRHQELPARGSASPNSNPARSGHDAAAPHSRRTEIYLYFDVGDTWSSTSWASRRNPPPRRPRSRGRHVARVVDPLRRGHGRVSFRLAMGGDNQVFADMDAGRSPSCAERTASSIKPI